MTVARPVLDHPRGPAGGAQPVPDRAGCAHRAAGVRTAMNVVCRRSRNPIDR
jgi:hypothetical protein